jgi:hypothetical protein
MKLERDRRREGAEWDEYRLWGIPSGGRGVYLCWFWTRLRDAVNEGPD